MACSVLPCAGERNTKIDILERVETNVNNEKQLTYNVIKTLWAKVRTVKTVLTSNAPSVGVNISSTGSTHEVTMVHFVGLSVDNFIRVNGENLAILSIDNIDEKNEALKAKCHTEKQRE